MSPEFKPEPPPEEPQQETGLVVPAKRLRPHHAFNQRIQDALLKRVPPQQNAAEMAANFYDAQQRGDPTGYYDDILRKTYRDFYTFEHDAWEYFKQLGELPDNSLMNVTLDPDGLCDIMRKGLHCRAINAVTRPLKAPQDTLANESRAVETIANALWIAGYGDETYARERTPHVLFDYEGQTLNACPNGKPTLVTFNSMLVQTEALRDIMARGLLNEY